MDFYERLVTEITGLQRRVERLERIESPGEWQDWTPTLTQNVSVSFTTSYARYLTVGRLVVVRCLLLITGAGTGGNVIVVGGIPAAIAPAHSGATPITTGAFSYFDTGTSFYAGSVFPVGVSTLQFICSGVASYLGATPNFAAANGDRISFNAVWER